MPKTGGSILSEEVKESASLGRPGTTIGWGPRKEVDMCRQGKGEAS